MKRTKKESGRPAGSPNEGNNFPRTEWVNRFRASEGMVKTLQVLRDSGRYKSDGDILHEALQQLANRQAAIQDTTLAYQFNYYRDRII